MADQSEKGVQQKLAMIDDGLKVLETHRGEKACNGLHALSETFHTYMAREMPTPQEKYHGVEIAAEIAARSGYEAVGMAKEDFNHGLEVARVHNGVKAATKAMVENLVRMGEGPNCPGCISRAVIMGLADGLLNSQVAPDAVIAKLREVMSNLKINNQPVIAAVPQILPAASNSH